MNQQGIYRRTVRASGELIRIEHKCEILKVNKNSYTIKIFEWYDGGKSVKTVQKKSVILNENQSA